MAPKELSGFFGGVHLKVSYFGIAFAFGLTWSGVFRWFAAKIDALLHEAL
jgi:hypothetical protein